MAGQKLALIIGNSEYADGSLSRLVTPDVDVASLADILRNPEVGGFEEVIALVNQPSAAVRRAISEFFVRRGRDDLLLLYFSGHGIRDDRGQLFLAVKDTEPNLLRGTSIPASFITEEMDNSRSKRQVLILDCCHSGAFSQGMKGAPGSSVGTASAFEGTGFGRVVLTATDSTQYAWEGDRVVGQADNSVFTQHLIEGLRSGAADTDADGKITLDELYDYVYEQVVKETPKQTPSKWSYGQQGEIIIAHNLHPVVQMAALPLDLQQTIDDPRSWVREGAVRELDRLMHTSAPGLALAAREALKRMANDDSRRVSTAATESLAVSEEKLQEASLPVTDILSSDFPSTDPTSVEKPSAIRYAHERKVAGVEENNQPTDKSWPAAMEGNSQPDIRTAMEENEPARPEPVALTQLTAGQLFDGLLDILASIFVGTQRKKALLIGVVWALGGIIAGQISTLVGLFLGGTIGGLSIGLALRQIELPIKRRQILIITAAWAICWAVSAAIADTIGLAVGEAAVNNNYLLLGWDNTMLLGKTIGRLLGSLLIGGIGGLAIGLALRQTNPAISKKTLWLIILDWAIVWAVGLLVLALAYEMTDLIYSKIILIVLGFESFMVGALSSLLMFKQLNRDRRSN